MIALDCPICMEGRMARCASIAKALPDFHEVVVARIERRKAEAFTCALVADAKHRQRPAAKAWFAFWCLWGLVSGALSGYLYDATGDRLQLFGLIVHVVCFVCNAWMLRRMSRSPQ